MRLTINKSITDERIIKDCLRGKREAQETLYEKYSSKMLAICVRYIKDRDEAEDIMISAFMKIFNKMEQFKGDGSFEGWMRRLVVNECLGFIRKNKSMYMAVDVEQAEREPDYQTLNNNLEVEDLMNLVHTLPAGYRTVFNLYVIEGYSHKEIADTLAISVNTSKSQLSRARTMLQMKLIEAEKYVDPKQLSNE